MVTDGSMNFGTPIVAYLRYCALAGKNRDRLRERPIPNLSKVNIFL
jgi:hypothetical protein